MSMTGQERISRILKQQPVDRIGLYEHFWGDTYNEWYNAGYIKNDESFEDHFGLDIQECWAFNLVADLDHPGETVEETEETILKRDGNGALLRWHKLHNTTPEHVDFLVKERAQWEEHIKPKLVADRRRINFEGYRKVKEQARKSGRFFCWAGVNVFECMHPVCGHEYMLMGMALDPDWVCDMVDTYSRLTVELQEILFAEEGYPDGIWFYEDMGFKQKPFFSPAMYDEIIKPGHVHTIGFAHSKNMPVIMHSCGFVEPLLPGMVDAGIDCLQVIEIKAGMDLLRIAKTFGKRLALMGGIDVRALYSNDKSIIDAELEAKVSAVMKETGFVLHSDHSIPKTVNYDIFKYYIEKGLSLGIYK